MIEMLVRKGCKQVVEKGPAIEGKKEGALMKSVKIAIRVRADLAREIALIQERVYRTQGFRLTKSATVEALIERGLEAMKADEEGDQAPDGNTPGDAETGIF